MTLKKEIYKCEVCGNVIEIVGEGMGTLVCCGKSITQQKENVVDASKEKHIPVIKITPKETIIEVGSIPHPMEASHYIMWIEAETEKGNILKFLKPGEKPEMIIPNDVNIKTARAYCNLHGLWKGTRSQ